MFFGTFLFAWLWVEPMFQYHSLAPVFLTTKAFLRQHLVYPGGPTDYAAAFLLQFYRISWLGALITAALACLLYLSTRLLLLRAGWRTVGPISLAIPVLFLDSQWYYEWPWMARSIAVLLALALAAVHGAIRRSLFVRLLAFLALLLPGYFIAAGAALLFAACCAITELVVERKPLHTMIYLALGALIPWLAYRFVWVITLQDAYGYLVPFLGAFPSALGLKLLFLAVPASQVLGPPVAWASTRSGRARSDIADVAHAKSSRSHDRRAGTHAARSARLNQKAQRVPGDYWWFRPLPWIALAVLVLALRAQPQQKVAAQLSYYADHNDWTRVTTIGKSLRMADSIAVHDINRALAHDGLLLEKMFEYPQTSDLDFWFDLSKSLKMNQLIKSSHLLLETGHVNRAERMAGEALELSGYRPETLRLLFLTSILKDRHPTALPFLDLMDHTIWDRHTAARYRAEFQKDPTLSADPELQRIRKIMVRQDYIGSIPDNVLMQITLRQDPQNRMALEYLVGFYLLKGQLDKVLQNLERFRSSGAETLPRHVQEAIALFQYLNLNTEFPMSGFTLDSGITGEYARFRSALASVPERPPLALAREFGNTYWYFYTCGQSGSVHASSSH